LWDSIARVLTVAHVGWRGTVKGTTGAAVKAAVQAGARANQLHVAIAPSIGPCCYEVDEPVMRDFGRAHGRRAQAWFKPARDGHARLATAGALGLVAGDGHGLAVAAVGRPDARQHRDDRLLRLVPVDRGVHGPLRHLAGQWTGAAADPGRPRAVQPPAGPAAD